MNEQIHEDPLYILLYGAVTAMSIIASCYLLFRRANAIAPGITTPVRLRRWTAALFAAMTLSHLWYLPMYFLSSSDDVWLGYFVGGLLDCMIVFPLAIAVLFTMLQDRRRPLWPAAAMVAPLVLGTAWCIATRSEALLPMLFVYFFLMITGLIKYMVRALRQYGRWLRDNYSDLEHKELRQSFVVLGATLLGLVIYASEIGGPAYDYVLQTMDVVLVCYLLWRVETLSELNNPVQETAEETPATAQTDSQSQTVISKDIATMLKLYCEDRQLYLQYDISLTQLAKHIGTNRSYLSKHFALQGVTYNSYINGLRIQYFIDLYHKAAATHRTTTAQQLALQSGFRSYSTFSAAFKQKMGQTVTEWMRNVGEQE